MRSKNSKPITDAERRYLADVKVVGCVFCNARVLTEAHHPKGCQGLHWMAISACPSCHAARVWLLGTMTEMQASNETRRRVDEFRETGRVTIQHITSRQNSTATPSKIIPRAA